MFAGKKKVLFAAGLTAGLLVLAGCYTQVKLFSRVSEEPPLVQEQREKVVPEYHSYYYHHYTPRWNEPYWYRSRFYRPSYLRWRSYWDYWDWRETRHWYEPCWDDAYWVRVYHPWYGSSYYRWGYYDYYPGYYYSDPWWGHRYYRQEETKTVKKPGPGKRGKPGGVIPSFFPSQGKSVISSERTRPPKRKNQALIREEGRDEEIDCCYNWNSPCVDLQPKPGSLW
jgi:hypothetical protein